MANSTRLQRWARWSGTFVGFPLAGATARAVATRVDTDHHDAVSGRLSAQVAA